VKPNEFFPHAGDVDQPSVEFEEKEQPPRGRYSPKTRESDTIPEKERNRKDVRQGMHAMRKIIHADCDAFYASVEQRDHPDYRGKPVVVGGDPEKRGVVATASYEARVYGIHSAQPARTAQRLCPHAIFLRPRFEVYRAVSLTIMDIFRSYSDILEPLSLDEAYLDVTANKRGIESATILARILKQDVYKHTGLTISVGVSFNRSLAKIASDLHKPDGLTVITPQQADQFLAALPIAKFSGVGKVTSTKLEEQGIHFGAELRQRSEEQLAALLGKHGVQLYHLVRGEDDRPVEPERIRKSVGKETTLVSDISDRDEMLRVLEELADQVQKRLKELNCEGQTVTLKVKFADFKQITRSITLDKPVQDAAAIMPHLRSLLVHLDDSTKQIRLLGVTLSTLSDQREARQSVTYSAPSLWELYDL